MSTVAEAVDSFPTFGELAAGAGETFLGIITIDETTEGRSFDGGDPKKQWHFGVQPKGASKSVQAWYTAGTRGQMAQVGAAIVKVYGAKDEAGAPRRPGNGSLIGLAGVFEKKAFTYFDKDAGEKKEARNPNILAVRKATPEELASLADTSTGGSQPLPSFNRPTYTEDEVLGIIGLMDGKTPAQYFGSVMKSPLSQDIKNAILSGEAVTYLESRGLISRTGDTVNATEAALTLQAAS